MLFINYVLASDVFFNSSGHCYSIEVSGSVQEYFAEIRHRHRLDAIILACTQGCSFPYLKWELRVYPTVKMQ